MGDTNPTGAAGTGSTDGADGQAPVVVVTGASRGIGAHLADAFAAAGYVVERCSRRGRSGEDGVEVVAVDVTDGAAVREYVDGVLARRGRIDVLVNNAGVIDAEVPLWEADPEEWWRTVEVDVRGPFLVAHAVVPHMLEAGGGRVVNLNSGSGTRSNDVSTAYYVAKSALGRITGGLHLAGYERGLRAFDLAPGVVRTDMTAGMGSHVGRTAWTEPHEVSELALALASGEFDAWSGRMVRAGTDTPTSLRAAEDRLSERSRQVLLVPWGDDDPLA
ncbi:SDR family NAD(P)-dependent oxidoreductase [Mobilicoccus pelagius]|uniref:Putative oxidoreductase n=1 Tax=Mobilicoccus pelagius NBRC 104925 TaxID=1089455 RepID=H5UPI3_9MICO|nr:SDR family oxidoreductase [Mobilicoccus pelagius]GAB47641.1 putative oxidoreductase [Mobilicoccus pelagius NBRC 104925]